MAQNLFFVASKYSLSNIRPFFYLSALFSPEKQNWPYRILSKARKKWNKGKSTFS